MGTSNEKASMILLPKLNWKRASLLVTVTVAFFIALRVFGYKIAPDSQVYIDSSTAVGPLYCLLIDLFQWIFGETQYVMPLIVFQNILIAYAVFSLVSFVIDSFDVKFVHAYVIVLGFYLLFVLQTVFTVQGRIPSNTILSEAIAFPLFFLFFKYALASALYLRGHYLVAAGLLSFLLINTRGQLAWLVALMIGLIIFVGVKRSKLEVLSKKWIIRFICGALTAGIVLLGVSWLLPRVYNQYKSGQFTGNSIGRAVVLTSVMYVSDTEDKKLFLDDPVESEMFESVYRFMNEGKLQSSYSPRGILNRFFHYEKNCDLIQARIRQNIEHLATTMPDRNIVAMQNKMILALGTDNFSKYICHYATNALGGLVRSVALLNKPFSAVAIVLYLGCIFVTITRRKDPYFHGAVTLLALCLICIVLNVLFTSFGVWCLSRYMFYNFPIFYMGMYLTLIVFWNLFRTKKIFT
ncbi:MAG: hypothetical protein LLF75_07965 [Eubacteriales bacterium]|nr:hypothetical protein [Eubacteriales bacterium]